MSGSDVFKVARYVSFSNGRLNLVASLHNFSATSDVLAEVFLGLLEKDRIQQSSVVVVEFDYHDIFIKTLSPERNRISRPHNQTADSGVTPVSAFLHRVRSVAILLSCVYRSLTQPRQNVTIGSEHCHAGHVQA